MQPWNLETTKSLAAVASDDMQAEKLWSALQSIHKRQYIAGYHFHEYKRLLREKLDPRLERQHPLELIFAPEIDDKHFFRTLHLQVVAHVLACMQSMHALADTLAYAITFSLKMNIGNSAIEESKISIDSVAARLKDVPALLEVQSALSAIQKNQEFTYLSDAVNHSKHRSLICADFSFDATGTAASKYELYLPQFEFKCRLYGRRDVSGFLEPLYSWLSPQIVNTGNALNRALALSQA